jgi:hypothetical protein
LASVPLLSPRETKGARTCQIDRNAATGSWVPAIFTGSLAGPTMTKSFQQLVAGF